MTVILPETLPWRFGDYSPPPDLEALDGTPLAWVPDHGASALELLIVQFRDKPRLAALIRALAAGIQDIEDGAWQVITERSLESAIGVQLDGLGQIVGLPRSGWHDELYRALLRARVLVLRSEGTWGDAFRILEVLGAELAGIEIDEPGTAAMRVRLTEALDDIDAGDVFQLLDRARPAAVRLTLEHVASDIASAFTLSDEADAPLTDAARGLGDSDDPDVGGELAGAYASTETV